MKFLEILGYSVAATLAMLFIACVTAWLCTFEIGSWLVLMLLCAVIIYVCAEANEEKTFLQLLWKEILPVCPGLALVLTLLWYIGHLITEGIIAQASIGFNIVCGMITVISCAAVCVIIVCTLQLLGKIFDYLLFEKHNNFNRLQEYVGFIVSLICNLGITIAVVYYILYPIGLL